MQLDFNFNKRNLSDEKSNTFANFVSGFINELSNYLENARKYQNLTYCVMSDVNKDGKMYVVAQNGTGVGKSFSLDELPSRSNKRNNIKTKIWKICNR